MYCLRNFSHLNLFEFFVTEPIYLNAILFIKCCLNFYMNRVFSFHSLLCFEIELFKKSYVNAKKNINSTKNLFKNILMFFSNQ